VDDWFRSSVGGKMEDILMDCDSLLYQYLQPAAVQRMYSQHRSGRSDYHKILFSLVVFEEWLRANIGSQASPMPATLSC